MNTPIVLSYFSQSDNPYLEFLQEENNAIAESWEEFKNSYNIDFFPRQSVDSDKIDEDIRSYKHRIIVFHYSGHADNQHLIFKDTTTNAIGLAGLLGEAQNLKLVFLNGCATSDQVNLLFSKNIKLIIATKGKVSDGIAKEFATIFYEALTSPENYSIKQAFGHSVNAMINRGDISPDTLTTPVTWRGLITKVEDEKDRWELYVNENYYQELEETTWWKLKWNVVTPTKQETLKGGGFQDTIIRGFVITLFVLGIAIIIKYIFFDSDLKFASFGFVPILFSYFGYKNQQRYKTTLLNADLVDRDIIKKINLFS